MNLDEKTVKKKSIRIDNRYVYTDIIFQMDEITKDKLEMYYTLTAVNDNFESQSLIVDLTKDTTGLINELRVSTFFIGDEYYETNYRFESPIVNAVSIIIDKDAEIDDMNRDCVIFGYVVNNELIEITIPKVIYPIFINTFIDILQRKDIITDEQDNQDDSEDQPSTNKEDSVQQ